MSARSKDTDIQGLKAHSACLEQLLDVQEHPEMMHE